MDENIKEISNNIKLLLLHEELDFVKQALILWDGVADSYGVFQAIFETITSLKWSEEYFLDPKFQGYFQAFIRDERLLAYVYYWFLGKVAEFPEMEPCLQQKTKLKISYSWKKRSHFLWRLGPYIEESEEPYEIPDNIANLRYVQEIDYSESHLKEAPGWIQYFSGLKTLNLRGNELEALPSWIGELKELTLLELSDNKLKSLPSSIGNLQKLEQLELKGNPNIMLPEALGLCKNISHLSLRENYLDQLPDAVGRLEALSELDLRKNNLSSLPEGLASLEKLEKIDLSNNRLKSFVEGAFTVLKELNLANNLIRELPASFIDLPSLEALNLRNNSLSALPKNFTQLKTLRRLDLTGNHLRYLPEDLFTLAFDTLEFGADDQVISKTFGKDSGLSAKTNGLLHTDQGFVACLFAKNPLQSLPASIHQYSNISRLWLSFPLKDLPKEFGNLKQLKLLNLIGCRLEHFPRSILELQNLQELHLRGNKLETIPEEICDLDRLRILNVVDNNLEDIPASIWKMTSLKQLHLRGNKLEALPEEIVKLVRLSVLNLADNQLEKLPRSLQEMTHLKELRLQGNHLSLADIKAVESVLSKTKLTH